MRDIILEIIKKIKNINIEEDKEDYRLLEDFNMDSIEVMEMVIEIENELEIEFSLTELDLENFMTVKNVEEVVAGLLQHKNLS